MRAPGSRWNVPFFFASLLALATAGPVACGSSGPATPADAGSDAGADAGADGGPDAGSPVACQGEPDAGGIGQACCAASACLSPTAVCAAGSCAESRTCLGDSKCPSLEVVGDAASSAGGALKGMADPSIRRALDGTTLYMGYSWPTSLLTSPRTLSLETHLASSSDDGATWTFARTLFSAAGAETIPGSNPAQPGVHCSEEISLASAALDLNNAGNPYWVSVREKYYRPLGGQLDYSTYHLRVGLVQASSPAGLGDGEASEQVILDKTNSASFRAAMPASHVELTAVLQGTGQDDCDYPVSPALHYDPATHFLYLVLQCYVGGSPAVAAGKSRLIVLRTQPFTAGAVQPPVSWAWEYRGSFAGADDAALMQANGVPAFVPNMVLQPDLAVSNGTLLLIASPDIHDASGDGRTGCQVFEMEGIDPPALKKRNGQLIRHALVDAPDLDATRYDFGSQTGSCGYAPGAKGAGLTLARKVRNASGVIVTSLNATGIHE